MGIHNKERPVKIVLLTNEYPPHIYGGAGVHVEYLTREFSRLKGGKEDIHILCFGEQKDHFDNVTVEGVRLAFDFPFQDQRHQKLLDTLFRNLIMAGSVKEADIVHCHTWYTHLAGCLIKQIFGIPLAITIHSLEPQRPWKEEQLGTAYHASAWVEKTAYENADGVIAVSRSMKRAVHDLYKVPFERIDVIPQRDRFERIQTDFQCGSVGFIPDRSLQTVPPFRRPYNPTKRPCPSYPCRSVARPGHPSCALCRRPRHPGDR